MNNNIVQLIREFQAVKEEYEKAEAVLKILTTKWDQAEADILEAMIEEGVSSVNVDGIGTASMRTENYLSVNAANTEQFYQYLKISGNGALLKESVNPRTLQAWLKQHLVDLSEGFETATNIDKVSARDKALEFLKEQGANYFTKRGISVRK